MHSRDEHRTGSGLLQILLNLDWIRTVNHFKTLDPDRIWTELMKKKRGISHVKRLHFSISLDLDFAFEKNLGLWLDLD